MHRTELIKDLLVRASVRPSYPRIRILGYLMGTTSHPTAEEVYENLVTEMPTLSRTTVHNTLKLFVDAGLARLVTIDPHQMRFDGTAAPHGHFQCRRCGRVYDFTVRANDVDHPELDGFLVEDRDVYFRGLCRDCSKKETQEGGTNKNGK